MFPIRKVFWCFQGVEKGCIGNKWVNFLQKSCKIFENFQPGKLHGDGIDFEVWFYQNHANLNILRRKHFSLTLSWRRPLSYRNQWCLYDNGLRLERVKGYNMAKKLSSGGRVFAPFLSELTMKEPKQFFTWLYFIVVDLS